MHRNAECPGFQMKWRRKFAAADGLEGSVALRSKCVNVATMNGNETTRTRAVAHYQIFKTVGVQITRRHGHRLGCAHSRQSRRTRKCHSLPTAELHSYVLHGQ